MPSSLLSHKRCALAEGRERAPHVVSGRRGATRPLDEFIIDRLEFVSVGKIIKRAIRVRVKFSKDVSVS
jgi:hypothetical protein